MATGRSLKPVGLQLADADAINPYDAYARNVGPIIFHKTIHYFVRIQQSLLEARIIRSDGHLPVKGL
jgi:hypothetical protein